MTSYPLIMRAVSRAVWAILPEKLDEIKAFLALKAAGVDIAPIEAARRGGPRQSGAIAVIPIFGTITQRANLMTETSGGTSTEIAGNLISDAIADPNVASILLDIDSPGGTIDGVPELAALIRDGRAHKPIVASSNSLMASAAYWIGSAASEVVGTPSSRTGSIGVFTVHEDVSAALANEGVNPTIISAGRYKVEGNPFEPLDDESRAAIQSEVDEAYADFTADVARGRGVNASQVRGGFGEGRVLSARRAHAEGLIDRIETQGETLRRMARNPERIGMRAATPMAYTQVTASDNIELRFPLIATETVSPYLAALKKRQARRRRAG